FNDPNISDPMILVGYFWKSIFKKKKITKPSRKIIFLKNWCDYSYENVAKMCKPLSIEDIKKENTDDWIPLILHHIACYDLWYKIEDWDKPIWEIINKLSPTQFIEFWDSQSLLDVSSSEGQTTYTVKNWSPLIPNTLKNIEIAKNNINNNKKRLEKNNIHINVNYESNQIKHIEA
ncbi:hypothetical protein, partial [Lactococcus petauri]